MIIYHPSSILRCCSRLSTASFLLSPIKSQLPFDSSQTLFQPKLWRLCTRACGSATATIEEERERDCFFTDGVSWKSLGVSDQLSRALSNAGLEKPSLVQAACIPYVLSGNDVVVAAETGSGKTHAYLVPLIDKLCPASDSSGVISDKQPASNPRELSVVLCPNVMLCEQVVRMANYLNSSHTEPLVRVSSVCGRQGWPVAQPDILVSTPAALLNWLFDFDKEKRRRAAFMRDVKYVVFDEADMLLCGSFQNQVIRLIDMFRFDEKSLSKVRASSPENSSTTLEVEAPEVFKSEDDEELLSDEISEEEDAGSAFGFSGVETDKVTAGLSRVKYWSRARKTYVRSKQYIFVAATLPESGKKTAGGVLKRMFPGASWVSGNFLHRHNPRLEQRWIEVTTETQVDALIDAVKGGLKSATLDSGADVRRTMVFANTVDAVELVAKILSKVGIECISYHSQSSLEERERNLADFRERGGVLVCTDAAARGLDIPNVSHIIQAEFATSAVDFLHRVGRTARAGQSGLVTSLYTVSNRDLVAAVHQAEKLGQPVERAFSRKRSFRNKLKRQRAAVGS